MDIRRFFIKPKLPEKISSLETLSENMWAYWDKDAKRLFHRLDPHLFREVKHNALELLYKISPEKLEEATRDKGFLYELKKINEKFKHYMSYEGTYLEEKEEVPLPQEETIVYTSMEYGIHESIPFYSGGLAILAGDHLKASSDVGVPMVAFGLLYKKGYFSQKITSDGMQIEEFKDINWSLTPIKEALKSGGSPLIIKVPIKGETVHAKIWKLAVGRTILFLLDTNIHQNPPKFRKITEILYDADINTRIEQELILGRGTIIALKELAIEPKVYHINEGHTAFLIFERLKNLIGEGFTLDEARAIIKCSTVFTTHTPVIEGNEHYPENLIKEYLGGDIKESGISIEEFLSFGKVGTEKIFWLPAFALRYSKFSNGVSKMHSNVSKKMWRNLFPNLSEHEIPIGNITNGVHIQSWLSLQMTELFDRYIGPDYFHKANITDVLKGIDEIPDSEIWNAHCRRKEQVVSFVRRSVINMMQRRGYGNKIKDIEKVLNPNWLTIGFARRFAPYKRGNLILTDPERLASILTNKERPVQLIFAGKAHPADDAGKRIIKEIFDFIGEYPVEHHVVFLEDYDINIARHIVQGVDVWLNTPVKPLEASGTSGIKAGINGVLNLSVLDGWWPEAYNQNNGWAISAGEGIDDANLSKKAEAYQLYDLLENEITELYYDKKEGNFPVEWVSMMKDSIAAICSGFNMQRTVRDYLNKYYIPEINLSKKVTENNYALLKSIHKCKEKIDAIWDKVYLKDYFTSIDGKMPVAGEDVTIECYAYLDDIPEDLVTVEVVYYSNQGSDTIKTLPLKFTEKYPDRVAKYSGSITLTGNGLQEISARIVPLNSDFRVIYPEYVKYKN